MPICDIVASLSIHLVTSITLCNGYFPIFLFFFFLAFGHSMDSWNSHKKTYQLPKNGIGSWCCYCVACSYYIICLLTTGLCSKPHHLIHTSTYIKIVENISFAWIVYVNCIHWFIGSFRYESIKLNTEIIPFQFHLLFDLEKIQCWMTISLQTFSHDKRTFSIRLMIDMIVNISGRLMGDFITSRYGDQITGNWEVFSLCEMFIPSLSLFVICFNFDENLKVYYRKCDASSLWGT